MPSRGRAIVTMWATYCPPCVEELPMFDALHDEGLAILGVSFDDLDERADVKALLAKHEAHHPQVILTPDAVKQAGLVLEGGLPFALVLEDGVIVASHSGKMSEAEARAALARE